MADGGGGGGEREYGRGKKKEKQGWLRAARFCQVLLGPEHNKEAE